MDDVMGRLGPDGISIVKYLALRGVGLMRYLTYVERAECSHLNLSNEIYYRGFAGFANKTTAYRIFSILRVYLLRQYVPVLCNCQNDMFGIRICRAAGMFGEYLMAWSDLRSGDRKLRR